MLAMLKGQITVYKGQSHFFSGGRCGRVCIVVGYTTTYVISAYHH